MRWEDERYVRAYTRDTIAWLSMGWQARCTLSMLFRKLDRAGLLELGDDGLDGLSVALQLPLEVVELGLATLLKRGTVRMHGTTLFVPNFVAAQEARQSDKARQRAARERAGARADAIAKGLDPDAVTHGDTPVGSVPPGDTPSRDVSAPSRSVTEHHAGSHAVTPSCAVPSHTVPVLAEPNQAPPPPPGGLVESAPRPLPPSERRLHGDLWMAAYTSAVLSVGFVAKWSFDRKQLGILERVVSTHCPNRGAIVGWISATVAQYVRGKPEDAQYGAWQAAGLERWLNGGRGVAVDAGPAPDRAQPQEPKRERTPEEQAEIAATMADALALTTTTTPAWLARRGV